MRALSATSLAVVATVALGMTVGCARMGQLKASKSFKEANQAYQQQDYKRAAELYEATVASDPNNFPPAYFYLANSYDNLWKPSKHGDPANDQLLTKAVENYQIAADKLLASPSDDYKMRGKRSLEYLVAMYRADKLNEPAKAEPIIQRIIQMEPGEPGNYFELARLYEDAGVYDEAEKVYLQARDVKPNDPVVYTTLAAYYNRQGQFDKTIEALEQRAAKEPNNPEAFYTIAAYYWEKASKDQRLQPAEKKDFTDKGIVAVDRALQIKPDYMEALNRKNLLLRTQANLEKDPKVQQELLRKAKELNDKAEEIRKKKT
jgi:tetratricopeptide (TPR) repeat protein